MIKYIFSAKLVLFLIAVFSLGVNYNLYGDNRNLRTEMTKLKEDPQVKAKEEVKELVAKLSRVVALPEGEDPVVATVTDKEKLKDQPIFANAENGDKLLIYATAKRAYLYDPKNDKVRDIIPVNIGDQAGQIAGAEKTASDSARKK